VSPSPLPELPAYEVRRSSRARRARLTVTDDGQAVVVLPQRAALRTAALLVQQHTDWLGRQQGRILAERARLARRPGLSDGRVLQVAGIPHEVVVGDLEPGIARSLVEAARITTSEGVRVELRVRLGSDGRQPGEVLEAWLRREARRVIGECVAVRAPELGVRPTRLAIRAQRSRWGSATRKGSLSFNWRLLLAPPFVLDAVVVHELAHLRVLGHSPAFWAVARAHAPRTDEAKRWLRQHARELRAALD
jgi:predicted metal-dependent hydrolase